MNELFDDIGKRLPYNESEMYLENLIDEMTENAILRHHQSRTKRHWGLITASAASILLIIGIGFAFLHNRAVNPATVTQNNEGPIDEFLNSLTDEEVAMLPYYEIEEIPEY